MNRFNRSLIIIVCFLVYRYSKYLYAYVIFGHESWNNLSRLYASGIMLITGIVMAFVAGYAINKRVSLNDFGIGPKGFIKGLIWATLFCVPMFLGLGFISQFNFQPTLDLAVKGIVLAGFGEEFIFRAFLFGLLFFYAGWGFLSAGILTGLFFGAGHLYQADSFGSALAIFLFTTGASIGFAWFYLAWKSLWMVVFLHGFMDFIWDGYQIDTDVTGGLWVNVARFSTLIFAIVWSIRVAKENNIHNLKTNLWINTTAFA